jgi:hypothetical protein
MFAVPGTSIFDFLAILLQHGPIELLGYLLGLMMA